MPVLPSATSLCGTDSPRVALQQFRIFLVERSSCRRKRYFARGPLEQGESQDMFQLLDAASQSRLIDIQALCAAAKGEFFRHDHKGLRELKTSFSFHPGALREHGE